MDPSPSAADAGFPAPVDEPSRLQRLSAWLRPTLVVGLLTFAAGVVFGNVIPTRAELAATERRLDEQRAVNERLKLKMAELHAETERLAKDPWRTERILRDQLKMSGDDEVIVR
jgi:cell division protein FtsB